MRPCRDLASTEGDAILWTLRLAADEVKKSAFAMARAIREAFMNMGDRLSFEFAGETDETVINQTLTEELRKVLEELCKEVSE